MTRKPITSTTSGAASASSGTSTDAIATPAAPSDQASDVRSRHGAEPSCAQLLRRARRDISDERHRQDGGDPGARQAARRQPLAGAGDASAARPAPTRHSEEAEQHEPQPAIDGRAPVRRRAGARARSRAGAARAAARAMPPTHISQTSSSRAISSVQGMRLAQDVTADDLQPDDRGLRDDERAMAQCRRASAATRSGAGPPCGASRADRLEPRRRRRARAPRVCQSRSAAGRRSAARRCRGSSCRCCRELPRSPRASSCGPIARWRRAASSAAASSCGRGRRPAAAPAPRVEATEPEHAGDVARARHEARDLEEALLQRRAGVVLVAVDDAGLQRRVDLAERHRRRARAHQLDGLDVDRRLDRPDLQARRAGRAR